MIQVGASLLNSKDLNKDISKLRDADYLHIDIMDGKFVKKKTKFLNKQLNERIKNKWRKFIEGHFMVVDPWNYIDYCSSFHTFIFHIETKNVSRTIQLLKKKKVNIGLSINPETPVKKILPYLKHIDKVLVMTVHPGKGGQELIKKTKNKISELKRIKHKQNIKFTIAVDGGINTDNYYLAVNSGAESLAVGYGILSTKDYSKTIRQLKSCIHIGADHRGFKLKEHLIKYLTIKKYAICDHGAYNYIHSDDYPDYGQSVAKVVSYNPDRLGILICGSGVGVCISANRYPYVFASLCHTENQAEASKKDDYSNILCMGADFTTIKQAEKIVSTWLGSRFIPNEKHVRRINKIDDVDIIY